MRPTNATVALPTMSLKILSIRASSGSRSYGRIERASSVIFRRHTSCLGGKPLENAD
ncbi:MAG: hypothetical protein MUE84_04825 [Hyphomonas sp.]|nr:hypothetical protein [Hyphomonas sp.]